METYIKKLGKNGESLMNEEVTRNAKGQFVKGENIKNLVGQRFGKLVVLSLIPKTTRKTFWLCKCDCGNEVIIRSDCLGITKSCGCLKKQQDIKNLGITYNHNLSHHKNFSTWVSMIQRTTNKNQVAYKDYGGRGIKVCDEWKDPKIFLEWADTTYIDGYTIERNNVNGDYEPNNCTWIPLAKQACNTRKSIYIIINGEKDNITHWAKRLHINYKKLKQIYANNLVYNS